MADCTGIWQEEKESKPKTQFPWSRFMPEMEINRFDYVTYQIVVRAWLRNEISVREYFDLVNCMIFPYLSNRRQKVP